MISRRIIKENAKAQLGNNIFGNLWLMALLVLLIESALVGAAASIGLGIAELLLVGPLAVGVVSIFVSLVRGKNEIFIEDLFNGFKINFGRNFLIALLTGIFTILWSLLFIIPGLVAIFRYSMAFFILADHPDYPPVKCIEESCRLMNGNKDKLFRLILSLAGWFILAELPRLAVDLYARGYTVESFDPSNQETFRTIVDTVMLGPVTLWGFAAGAGLILVEIYLNASECCFYDMLTENIVFKVYEPEEVTETQLASENEAAELIEETENDENN